MPLTPSERARLATLTAEPDPWPDEVEDGPVEPMPTTERARVDALFEPLTPEEQQLAAEDQPWPEPEPLSDASEQRLLGSIESVAGPPRPPTAD